MPPKRSAKHETLLAKLLKELLKDYEQRAAYYKTTVCNSVKSCFRKAIEDDQPVTRLLVDPQDRKIVEYWADNKLVYAFKKSEDDTSRRKDVRSKQLKDDKPLVKLLPLVEAIRAKRYTLLQEILVWDCYIENDDMIALTGLFDKGCYLITRVEFINCFLDVKSIGLLAANITQSKTLRELCLDFNDIGERGCHILCDGLVKSQCLVYLSLCFCGLTKQCGLWLGNVIAETAVRELILDGNFLEAEGTIDLLSRISDAANQEGFERTEGIRKKQLLSEKTKSQGRIKLNNLTSVGEEHENNIDLEHTSPSTPTSLSSIKSSAKSSKKKSSKGNFMTFTCR
ncbi:Nalp (Nacht leucine rich repeat and pyrin domain containing) [Schistosoma japonicum]|nr:Nalp (Nacht leucine rich repeat and pyrin domain containing) [Schistosoma japonicum]KAH8871285.1 Nalp (Nacht leucine rich repeat and pyrin domain containing) [Schistosoma japonicum]KAH8871287.1 Nalp (Nacht leucine rich repeat and pyrin domain containing) [Schistosoma japonicum]